MKRLLERAGVPKPVLALINDIVDTCVACRSWARPLPDAQASVEIADTLRLSAICFYLRVNLSCFI